MSRHATVAALVRRTCRDADELLAMLGVLVDGEIVDDPPLEPMMPVQPQPKVGKRAQVEHPHAMDARPKVSTAPEALRNLPPASAPVRSKGGSAEAGAANLSAYNASRLAPCGSESAKRRHRKKKETCEVCGPGVGRGTGWKADAA